MVSRCGGWHSGGAPEGAGAAVAQDGPGSAGEHRGQVNGEPVGAWVANGVDRAVEWVEGAQTQSVIDFVPGEPESEQLST